MPLQKISRAFTLIETLVVIGILTVIAIIVLPNFLNGDHAADLAAATQSIVATLRLAESQSAQQFQGAQWGVHFSNATNTAPYYAIFSGSSYASGTVQNVYRLPSTVGFTNTTIPAGSTMDVVFSLISGSAPIPARIGLNVISQPAESSTISVLATGAVVIGTSQTGNIYATDFANNQVEIFDSSGNYITQFGNSYFRNPDGIAMDSIGNVYVVDLSDPYIYKFTTSGIYQTQFGGSGSGNGQFLSIGGIAIDSSGNLYLTDEGNCRVEELGSSGNYITQFGSCGFSNNQFARPMAIAVDSSGSIYVADPDSTNGIKKFNASGVYQTAIGSVGMGTGQFFDPAGLAVDAHNNIFVVDGGNNRIEEFNALGGYINQFYGTGSHQFSNPDGIAIDASGNIYVSDSWNHRIEKFDSSGNYLSQVASSQLSNPAGLGIY